jgi:hypothetical protein
MLKGALAVGLECRLWIDPTDPTTSPLTSPTAQSTCSLTPDRSHCLRSGIILFIVIIIIFSIVVAIIIMFSIPTHEHLFSRAKKDPTLVAPWQYARIKSSLHGVRTWKSDRIW